MTIEASNITRHSFTITTTELIERFYGGATILERCKECSQYGCSWSCPPLSFDPLATIRKYRQVTLYLCKIDLGGRTLRYSGYFQLMRQVDAMTDVDILRRESETQGMASLTIGQCLLCGDLPCSRPLGLPCRHPERVRPSLEALGMDVTAIARHLFATPILWGSDGNLPSYIVKLSALFY